MQNFEFNALKNHTAKSHSDGNLSLVKYLQGNHFIRNILSYNMGRISWCALDSAALQHNKLDTCTWLSVRNHIMPQFLK